MRNVESEGISNKLLTCFPCSFPQRALVCFLSNPSFNTLPRVDQPFPFLDLVNISFVFLEKRVIVKVTQVHHNSCSLLANRRIAEHQTGGAHSALESRKVTPPAQPTCFLCVFKGSRDVKSGVCVTKGFQMHKSKAEDDQSPVRAIEHIVLQKKSLCFAPALSEKVSLPVIPNIDKWLLEQ